MFFGIKCSTSEIRRLGLLAFSKKEKKKRKTNKDEKKTNSEQENYSEKSRDFHISERGHTCL